MKKIMMIAVLIGGMLVPAQMMAQNNNRNNNKPVVENRNNPGKNGNIKISNNNRHIVKAVQPRRDKQPVREVCVVEPRPVVVRQPAPPPVVVVNDNCSKVADVAAVAIGLVGLISLIAN